MIEIETADDGATVEVADPIERRKVSLRFPSAVSPDPADADAFVYPVDHAVSVRTDAVTVTDSAATMVLDATGETKATLDSDSRISEVDPGEYYLDVSNHVKTYLRVDAPEGMTIERDDEATTVEIDFGTEVELRVGARSSHERPEATITTTPAPEDVMVAVSYLGSALKDFGPMRSFATLRGHPPRIEIGEELHVPEEIEKPETGITIEVPPAYEYVYPIAPLAYYLGADVVPGERAVLSADGFEYDLDGPGGFEETVERVLKQVFTCDCFVRAGGPYSYELADREAFVRDTGLDPDDLYDRPLAEQVEAYLEVPFEVVEQYVPEWGVAAHLEPMPASVEYLPFLSNDLAVIRSPAVDRITASADVAPPEQAPADGEFTRSTAAVASPSSQDGMTPGPTPTPAAPDSPAGPTGPSIGPADEVGQTLLSWPGSPPQVVSPESLDAQEQLWIADGIPLGADRPTIESYLNALDRDPVEGEIEILVVCNDDRMAEEDEGVRELLNAETPFDVTIRPFRNVTTDELRLLLERGADFLHYIGHIDEEGFACRDGHLDTSTLEEVNVDAFFLNACRSYDQGRELVEAGAIAGVVTLEDVLNTDAVSAGRMMARLLNSGFPIDTALGIASDEHGIGDQYTVVGDGGIQVAQAESHAHLIDAEPAGGDEFEYHFRSFVSPQFPLGSAFTPTIDGVDGWYLAGDAVNARVSGDDLREALAYEDEPMYLDGDFGWSTDVAERLSNVADYRSNVNELTDLAIELSELEEETPENGRYEEVEDRFADLRGEVEDLAVEFDSTDFRTAFRTVLAEE